MDVETYPAFLTPRDEESNLSSSEEKSSEFDWLERKRMRKQKQSKCSVFYFLPKTVQRIDRYIFDPFYKGNYKLYIRAYLPFFQT